MTKIMHGKVHGRTIELDEDPGVAEGQEVEVQVMRIDERAGKISLAPIDPETNEAYEPPERPREGGDRGGRDRDRGGRDRGRGGRDRGDRGGRGDRDRGPRAEGGDSGGSSGEAPPAE